MDTAKDPGLGGLTITGVQGLDGRGSLWHIHIWTLLLCLSIKASFPEQLYTITSDPTNNRCLPSLGAPIRPRASEVRQWFQKENSNVFLFPKRKFQSNWVLFFFFPKSSHYTFRGMLLEAVTGGLVFMSMLFTVCSNYSDSPHSGAQQSVSRPDLLRPAQAQGP